MTIQKFRTIDLIVLSLIALIVDVIGYFASQGALVFFYVTLSTPIMMIAYIRWNYRGLIVNVVAILVYTILYKNFELIPLIGYTLSVMSIGLVMFWFKIVKPSRIKDEVLILTLYYLSGYLLLFGLQVVSQWIINGQVQWITMITRHSINFALGWVIMLIASRQQDFMVDMKTYLRRQIEERKNQGL
ncbi:MAG: hypothetical protein K9L02_08295 [Acholeplasmataceae bacterium]|nr:hypothetical protein [Acholeplasmataceae bacterium]